MCNAHFALLKVPEKCFGTQLKWNIPKSSLSCQYYFYSMGFFLPCYTALVHLPNQIEAEQLSCDTVLSDPSNGKNHLDLAFAYLDRLPVRVTSYFHTHLIES